MITAIGLVLLGAFAQAAPLPIRIGLVAVAAVAIALREFGVVGFPLPQNARQVPQWMTAIPGYGALQFGIEMGTGMRTYLPTGLPHLLALAMLLLADPAAALLAGLGFGLGRVAMMLTVTIAVDPDIAYREFSGIGRYRPAFTAVTLPLLLGASASAVL